MKKLFIALITLFLMTGCGSELKYQSTTKYNETFTTYQDITYDEYSAKIDNKDSFILLLYKTSCTHCQSFEPTLNQIISDYNLKIYALNLENLSSKESAVVANKTFVTGTPTTVSIKDGSYEDKLVGDKDEEDVIEFLISTGYLEEK